MNTRIVLCGIILLMAMHLSPAQSVEEEFLKGNIAYGNQQFEEAEAIYRTVLDTIQSAEVHYNLGNTLAQQGEWAEAAFHYLHAHALDPHLDAAEANLLLATNRLNLKSDYPDLPRPAKYMSERQWTTAAAILFWCALILLFHGEIFRFRMPFSRLLGLVALLLTILSVGGIIQHKLFKDWAVVSSSLASLRVAPTDKSPGESVLIEGDPVRIIGQQKDFFHVMASSGNEGFVLRDEVFHLPRY